MLKSKKQILSVCHVLKRHGIIFDSNGGILVCNGLFDYPIGQYGKDFVDAAGLANFLNSPRIVGYYNRLACYPSQTCATCSIYDDCGGGCPLRWTVYDPNKIIKVGVFKQNTQKGGNDHGKFNFTVKKHKSCA